jgi:hypothetical protein
MFPTFTNPDLISKILQNINKQVDGSNHRSTIFFSVKIVIRAMSDLANSFCFSCGEQILFDLSSQSCMSFNIILLFNMSESYQIKPESNPKKSSCRLLTEICDL